MAENSIRLEGTYDPALVAVPPHGDVNYYQDSLVPYLRLKVTSRNKTWVYDRCAYGMHLKRQIGRVDTIGLPEARRTAYEWDTQIESGVTPPTKAERQERVTSKLPTMRDVWRYYLDTHLSTKASRERVEDSVMLHWRPIFDSKIAAVDAGLIRSWLQRIAREAGEPTANKHLVTIKAALNYCKGHGLIKFDVDSLKSVKPFKELERTSYLKTTEMPALMTALEKQSEAVRHAILLLIYTCQRKSNVLQMEWSEIDMGSGVWTIPAGKTKTSKPYAVPLTPKALDILVARSEKNKTGYVFPACRTGIAKHLTNLNTAWSEIKVEAGVPHLRIHDLRHTGATWLAQKGANAYIIQRALNHSSVRTSQRYVNLVHDDVRELLAATQ